MRQIEEKHGATMEAILRQLYYDEGLSQAEVAKKLRVPAGTLAGWMIRLGVNQRALAEQAAKELAS